jgi:RNA recognition motif-containing protein
MKLFVKGIEPSINEVALEAYFSQFGKVVSTKIVYDRITWESRGFGFIEFLKKDDALKAMETLNGSELKGKTLTVTEAEERRR